MAIEWYWIGGDLAAERLEEMEHVLRQTAFNATDLMNVASQGEMLGLYFAGDPHPLEMFLVDARLPFSAISRKENKWLNRVRFWRPGIVGVRSFLVDGNDRPRPERADLVALAEEGHSLLSLFSLLACADPRTLPPFRIVPTTALSA